MASTSRPQRGETETPSASEVARDVVIFFRQLRQRMQDVPSGGLTAAQSAILLRLDREKASSTTLLAAAEGVRSQTMTVTLNALEAKGLIERHPDADDGRRHVVTLSADGRALVNDGRELRHQWLARALDDQLSPDDLLLIGRSIRLLTDAVAS